MSPTEPREIVRLLDQKFVPKWPKPPYRDTDRAAVACRTAIAKTNEALEVLAEALVVQLHDGENGIAPKKLNRTPGSLQLIDRHLRTVDYPHAFKRDYLDRWWIPALGGYLALTVLKRIDNLQWKYGNKLYAHALQPSHGGRLFYPFALAVDAVFSGYRLHDFFEVVKSYAET